MAQEKSYNKNWTWNNFINLFESRPEKQKLDQNAMFLIESLPQLKRIVDLIPEKKLKQIYHGQTPLNDWKEIKVLGPTKDYYNSLFPSSKTFESFIEEEAESLLLSTRPYRQLKLSGISICDQLKNENQTTLTSTNKASIILAVDNQDKRYLFTGDAGVESFKSIPNYKMELKNLFFLKIPHHVNSRVGSTCFKTRDISCINLTFHSYSQIYLS